LNGTLETNYRDSRTNRIVTRPLEVTLLSIGVLIMAVGSFMVLIGLPGVWMETTDLFASQMIGLMAIYCLIMIFLFLYFSYGFFYGIERAGSLRSTIL
jgi:hypothetical protein